MAEKKSRLSRTFPQDLTGIIFGHLIPIEYLGRRSIGNRLTRDAWACKCECGFVKAIPRDRLICGAVTSCGCFHSVNRARNIAGQRFGRLLVVSLQRIDGNRRWLCQCDCGRTAIVSGGHLVNGDTSSCGCYLDECRATNGLIHGKTRTRAWYAWVQARRRCFKPKQTFYSDYGGRGITMCPEWANSFEAFYRDMGPCPDGLTLDRIDNDGNYEPGNCRWATRTQQVRNRRNAVKVIHNGETLSLPEWAERFGLAHKTVRSRYDQGKRGDDLFVPLDPRWPHTPQ